MMAGATLSERVIAIVGATLGLTPSSSCPGFS